MNVVRRFAHVLLYSGIGVASSFTFLFLGAPYPPDWCVATDDDSCAGLLAFLPLPVQQAVAVAVIGWCVRIGWQHQMEEERKERELAEVRERFRAKSGA